MENKALMNRVQSFNDIIDEEYSVAEVNVRVKSLSERAVVGSERRFTVTQMTWAIVLTHLATLALCLLVATVLCLRVRTSEDLHQTEDDDYGHARHIRSTGSSFVTGSDVKKMAADVTSETVYLRLNGMHPYRCAGSYMSDTSTTAVSLTR